MGKDCLYKYFLKGKQYQGDQPQLDVGLGLEEAAQCRVLSFLGHWNKAVGSHRSWVIQAAIYVGTRTREFECMAKPLLSWAPGKVQAHFSVVALIPILVYLIIQLERPLGWI